MASALSRLLTPQSLEEAPRQSALSKLLRPSLTVPPRGAYFTGGPVQKVFDVLRTGEYAVGGALTRRPEESLGGAALRGIRTREESGPQFAVRLHQLGMPDSFITDAVAFAFSLGADPINLLGVGIPGKALRAAGAAQAAARYERAGAVLTAPVRRAVGAVAERVAPGAMRAAAGRRLLEPTIDEMVRAEAVGVERVVALGKAIRKDAARTAGTVKDARRLDEALGLYFDAGADTMMNQLAKASGLPGAGLPANVVAAARQRGVQAQRAFLDTLDPGTRSFIEKWAPHLAEEDTRIAEALVQKGMLRPETAAKWQGIHLRRIYQQFEDPQEFVKFLEETNPIKAAELLGKIERGIPIQRVGTPIPTALTKQRQLLSAETRAAKGEIRQASSRFIAGGTMGERAVARGAAYQKIAQEFSKTADEAETLGLRVMGWRPMPEGEGWGALAGRWLPKELADPLLRMVKRPEGMDAFLQKTTGWFKFAKVILNPATHFRNIRTNIALAHNKAGLGALNPATWAKAIKEVTTNGAAFQEAKSISSAFVDTFTGTEIRRLVTDPTDQGFLAAMRQAGDRFSDWYQKEEQIGKMVVYLTERGRGLSPQAAAKSAELALFNYRKVPPIIDKWRRIGIYPFLTFPWKITTETIPQVIRRPGRFSQQAKVIGAIEQPMTEEERRALPDYMRRGTYVKLPLRVNGHPVLFDFGYELPYGDIGEAGNPLSAAGQFMRQIVSGDFSPVESLRTMIPILPPAFQIAAELILNRSGFTGREIVPEGETPRRQAELLGAHAARFAAPSILSKTILPGGELRRAVEATIPGGATGASPAGRLALPLPAAVASTAFGLRTVPLDVQRERRNRLLELQRMVRDVETQMRSVVRNQSLEPHVRQRRFRELAAQRQRLMQRYRETGTAIAP